MQDQVKRISLMIGEDQHRLLQAKGLNVSGLVRDLIADYLSEHSITLAVSDETKSLYEQIVANTGTSDECLEPYLRTALEKLLEKKISEMQNLRKKIKQKS